jgi:hypothetical protein
MDAQMPRGYDCKDAGGRAKSGTFAEDDQERRVIGDWRTVIGKQESPE